MRWESASAPRWLIRWSMLRRSGLSFWWIRSRSSIGQMARGGCGHWIDCYASCLYPNRKYFGGVAAISIFPFRVARRAIAIRRRAYGVRGRKEDRWLQPGKRFLSPDAWYVCPVWTATSAPPLCRPSTRFCSMRAMRDSSARGRGNACNVLDVTHPLWLCLRQTDHRREEAEAWVYARLPLALGQWHAGRGMAFDPLAATDQREPGLQGTEMWLSIIYLMADIAGLAGNLPYRPTGVHRLEVALKV